MKRVDEQRMRKRKRGTEVASAVVTISDDDGKTHQSELLELCIRSLHIAGTKIPKK